ncbi:uncharacterized protein RHO17_000761 isoform 1-T1 [Thomomys bottae]
MFLCCFRRTRDSRLRQERPDGHTEPYRPWVSAQPPAQCEKPLSRKKLRKIQGNSGKGDNDSAPSLNVWRPEAGLLEKLVVNMVRAHRKGELYVVRSFLHSYRSYGTMEQLLAILFKKYRCLRPHCEEDEQIKNALCCFFTMWMDFYPDDFFKCQNPEALHDLMYYVLLNMPSSVLLLRLRFILDQLEESSRTKRKKKSLCRRLRACLGRRRAAAPKVEMQNPAAMVMDGNPEPPLDSRQHVNIQRFVPLVVRPKEVLDAVDIPVVNPTRDTGEPAGDPEEEEDPEFLPLTFTVRPDRLQTSEVSTPAVQDEGAPEGLMENVPGLSSTELLNEVQKIESIEESESVLTEYQDKSVQLQEIQSPPEKLEPAPAPPQEGNSVFTEAVDPLEDPNLEFLSEVNLEEDVKLALPSFLPWTIPVFILVLIVVKCSLYLLF